MLGRLPDLLFDHYEVLLEAEKENDECSSGAIKGNINVRLDAIDELVSNSQMIVRAPQNPRHQEMKNVAGAVRKRLHEGKLHEAIEVLASCMGVTTANIITPKKRRFKV